MINASNYMDFLVDNQIATKDEVCLVTDINGFSEETMNDILDVRTGYKSIEQLYDSEPDGYDFSSVEQYLSNDDDEDDEDTEE